MLYVAHVVLPACQGVESLIDLKFIDRIFFPFTVGHTQSEFARVYIIYCWSRPQNQYCQCNQ